MPDPLIEFSCLEVTQPIGTFYIGVMNADDLVDISYADVRRMNERDVEMIVGIQRPLIESRRKEIEIYVKTIDASFPTGVILSVASENVQFDKNSSKMIINRGHEVAKIIDGQHRIAGLENLPKNIIFQINVIIFVDMEIEDQGLIFSTINLKQTRVSKSLAYDLLEHEVSRSPQKTCHQIARLMNFTTGSPFKDKIKILGAATKEKDETITQATFVERLLELVSNKKVNPTIDRDVIKRGESLSKISGIDYRKMPFRNLFIDGKDEVIARQVWNYFSAVEGKWENAWTVRQSGLILNKSAGFKALMRFLRDVIYHFGKAENIFPVEKYAEVFSQIKLKDQDFSVERYKPGAMGEKDLYDDLLSQSGISSALAVNK